MDFIFIGGARYFVFLYEHISAVSAVRFMKKRMETPEILKKMIVEMKVVSENRVGVRNFIMDNGGEFV